jgi:hypothetical protein
MSWIAAKDVKATSGQTADVVYDGKQDGVAVAIVRDVEGKKRLAVRWNGNSNRKLGFPQSSAHAAWFELPDWMEKAVLHAVADKITQELQAEKTP